MSEEERARYVLSLRKAQAWEQCPDAAPPIVELPPRYLEGGDWDDLTFLDGRQVIPGTWLTYEARYGLH